MISLVWCSNWSGEPTTTRSRQEKFSAWFRHISPMAEFQGHPRRS